MWKRRRIEALEGRIRELEAMLRAEQSAHAADQKELQASRSRAELEERGFFELREACTSKLSEIDTLAKTHRERVRSELEELRSRKEQQSVQLAREAEQARTGLQTQIAEERARAREEIAARVKSFGDNYNYYLMQIKAMMDLLTGAALHAGETFLTDDMPDTDALFREEIAGERLAEKIAAQRPVEAPKSGS